MEDKNIDYSIKSFIEARKRKNTRNVAALTRVSTKHEQQMNALDNQNEWIRTEIAKHSDWKFNEKTDLYVDNGVSGTSMKNRTEFNTMIERAKAGEYDLIITREVSRFMRNLKLTLILIDELKEVGVEVYFVNDGIWTFNEEDYFKLTIMGTYAEQESKKVSERVLAGQGISRQKGILYGNGNILGYDLIKGKTSEETTYVINEEQAETVKIIYELALEGKGIKQIKRILMENKRKNSNGEVKWYDSIIERILRNKTYCGYIEYFKSFTINPLTHKREKINDRSQRISKKGNFEPIIEWEIWNKVQKSIDSRINHDFNNKSRGIMVSQDVYCRKMRCECGRRFRKDKGRKDGMATYKCYNIIENGSKSTREKEGLSMEGYCELPGIIDWKLQLYTKRVFEFLTIDIDKIKQDILSAIEECFIDRANGVDYDKDRNRMKDTIHKLELRIEKLTDMRADGEITKEEFISRREKAKEEILELENKLMEMPNTPNCFRGKEDCIKTAETFLDNALQLADKEVSDDLIEVYVNSIKVYNSNVFEYNIKLNPVADSDCVSKDNDNYRICDGKSTHKIDNSNAVLLHEFTIEYDEAKKYANSLKRRVNRLHWQTVTIRIVADIV